MKPMDAIDLAGRQVGPHHPPLVIAEIGINHEGSMAKAKQMIRDAAASGCEVVKFQCHVLNDEMLPNNVIPGNAKESIWTIMERCAFDKHQELELQSYTHNLGMTYLSTPFSRAAANRLEEMGVPYYKIGSGECNNYPLVEHIASFGKPIILSTGMNDIASIRPSVEIFKKAKVPFILLHCTSMYPTPYEKVRLGSIEELRTAFQTPFVGLSCHSLQNYTCFGATALGACVLEKHFTSDKSWAGPDVPISIDPRELQDLIVGSRAIFLSMQGKKTILTEEKPTIDFAYASVVSVRPIAKGQVISKEDVWVKRPGTGPILAKDYPLVVGSVARVDIEADVQVEPSQLEGFSPPLDGKEVEV